MQARTLLAVILASLAGTIVYIALNVMEPSATTPAAAGGWPVMLALPAMLASMMFVTFVLLPLWHRLQRGRPGRLLLLLFGAIAWLLLTTALLAVTTWNPAERILTASQLVVPGLVVVLVFAATVGRG